MLFFPLNTKNKKIKNFPHNPQINKNAPQAGKNPFLFANCLMRGLGLGGGEREKERGGAYLQIT